MKSYKCYEMKNHVRAVRVSVGLTQTELALLLDTTQNTISSIERNEYQPSSYLAALMCELFQVPFNVLFYYEYEGVRANVYDIRIKTDEERQRHFQYLRNEAEFRKQASRDYLPFDVSDDELETITTMDLFFE